MKDQSSLRGEIHSKVYRIEGNWESNLKNPYSTAPCLSSEYIVRRKSPEINRKTKRRLAREINTVSYTTQVQEGNDELIELRKHLARPPGCSFLGAKATEAYASINDVNGKPIPVIVDSGSDITLISQKTLDQMLKAPKVRIGQRIKLIQVTGKAIITGYVILDLIFRTPSGPVQMNVEAYVVKGMSADFILGNDFADQYSISILREEGETTLRFGKSGRSVRVHNSLSSPFLDEDGHTFKVRVRSDITSRILKAKAHRKSQIRKRQIRHHQDERLARARHHIVIPPESSKLIPVRTNFNGTTPDLLVERSFISNGNSEELFGTADTLISRNDSRIFVSNFSKKPVSISAGQVLGSIKNPSSWLDKKAQLSESQKQDAEKRTQLIRTLVQSQSTAFKLPVTDKSSTQMGRSQVQEIQDPSRLRYSGEDPLSQPPVEGGPKTAEVPGDVISEHELLKELDISASLSQDQVQKVQRILVQHKEVFGLDGRLGNYAEEVRIPLIPETKPISIPPFHASPANREIIDKQMDSWLNLGVIEPSRSPWGAPVFIAYRNGKPRMVIDLRRLNEKVVADEFPLPRQDEILQSLEGSQYLSTLDALAGFTQLSIASEDREKLAFRCHRGLFQFKRMPFGYRNGPAIFQRVMQKILAPFLWIFALVYIDDIVIFSKSFEEHCQHIGIVLEAIKSAKITLSPSKCHFGYQSIMLLGQKVSRLGLSTHKEKVDAILQLDNPKNTHDLQVFLGMMVYFSSYIPFYAWIAHPLFQLLKRENKWVWGKEEQNAYDLCKQVLTEAPVRAHAVPGLPYRVYSDACDFAVAAILQQVQPIRVGDLKGTKVYEKLERAFKKGEPIPQLVTHLDKDGSDIPPVGKWNVHFDDTIVHVERVIAYWSRVLQAAERNYSPTEREALALKEGLIKFQPYLEGEKVLAITDHAALTWSKTFQNVNRRLLTWGLVFSAFPNMKIVHRAGRVHSNVDPISRLRRRQPSQEGPINEDSASLNFKLLEDPLKNMYEELGPQFEEKLLRVASNFMKSELEMMEEVTEIPVQLRIGDLEEIETLQSTSRSYSTLVGMNQEEISRWRAAYEKDSHFESVLESIRNDESDDVPFPQYHYSDNGLLYFEDNAGNTRMCVPKDFRNEVMSENHDVISEAAHGGYFKTYNRISATYYWPRMSREIKNFVNTCDVCQKTKPRKHAPVGLLQPIPIPTQPFEVVTMDFIPELPLSNGFDNILVIVDKLTKYAIFIPTTTRIGEIETARLFFKYVIAQFGIPRQIISDRDTRWRGDFWKEVCRLMGMKRSLTTSYHPQADGQTEVMNQALEISIRAYIGPERDDWSDLLDALALSYNTSPHTATGFSPAYLLRGYHPITGSTLLMSPQAIERDDIQESSTRHEVLDEKALHLTEGFEAERRKAQDALILGQVFQRKCYNKDRLTWEFQEGDKVVINRKNLGLLKDEKGRGDKLLTKYEGPFEIIQKLSPVSYRLRMPASFGMHPVLNIEHLEKYQESPEEFGERPRIKMKRMDFEELPEYQVDHIVAESWRKGRNGKRIPIYRVRYTGYGPEADTWEPRQNLKNAPMVLKEWGNNKMSRSRKTKQVK